MPHETAACQLPRVQTGDSRRKSTLADNIRVGPADQWITTTSGRIATDPYSWMQANHWVTGSDLYKPSRTHGPAWGPTTVLIAQEISALTECRPSVDYLARKLGCSERTVQYHLGMLREAGLLAYRVKGTRVSGTINQASVFERIIPAAFDADLGIRTTGSGVQRRPVGIAPESRTTIAKLARKAARKVRRTRRKRTRSRESLCTPMQGGTSGSSTTGSISLPSETTDLASGTADCPTPKDQKRAPRKLNKIGRRYQLARELIQQVDWLGRASVPRIAWVTRHVSDAGWSVDEVRAAIDRLTVAQAVHRPSGFLADRLRGVHELWNTPGRRAQLVADWRDCQRATAGRHAERHGDWTEQVPQSQSVRRQVADACRPRIAPDSPDDILIEAGASAMDIEALDRDTVISLRTVAETNPSVIGLAIDAMGEADARRLYTNRLVDRFQKTFSSNTTLNPWMETSRA